MNAVQLLLALNGRVNRATYWLAITPLALAALYGWLLSYTADYRAETLGSVMVVAVAWPLFAVHVKRWHDRGKSAWWMLVAAIPGAGQVWILVECGLLAGSKGSNKYGGKPQALLYLKNDGASSPISPKPVRPVRAVKPVETTDEPGPLAPGLVSLLKMMSLVVRSDPKAQAAKINTIRQFLIDDISLEAHLLENALSIVKGTRFSTDSFENHARNFKHQHAQDAEVLHAIADFLFELTMLDGELSGEEEILLFQVHSVFGFQGSAYASHRSSYEQQSRQRQQGQQRQQRHQWQEHDGQKDQQRTQEPPGASKDQERYHGEILGLKGRIGRSQIKRAYRDLVKQYHPDKVAHLGPKLKDAADLEMKKINAAYEYFRKKYNM